MGDHVFMAAGDEGLKVFVCPSGRPRLIAQCSTSETALALQVVADSAYVAAGGLEIFDVSRAAKPVRVGLYDDAPVCGLHVVGRYAYLACIYHGLVVLNVADPANPVRVGACRTRGVAQAVQVVGTYAYVGNARGGGLEVTDVANPQSPRVIARFEAEGIANEVRALGETLLVANAWTGLLVLDCQDPTRPREITSFLASKRAPVCRVGVDGRTAYIGVGSDGEWCVVDMNQPAVPRLLGRGKAAGWVRGVAVAGDHAYVAWTEDSRTYGLDVFDIANPAHPVLSGRHHDWAAWIECATRRYGPWVVGALMCVLIAGVAVVVMFEIQRHVCRIRPLPNRYVKAVLLNLVILGGFVGFLLANAEGEGGGMLVAYLGALWPVLVGAFLLPAVLVAWFYRWRS